MLCIKVEKRTTLEGLICLGASPTHPPPPGGNLSRGLVRVQSKGGQSSRRQSSGGQYIGGNIPGGNFPGGNFPGGNFFGGNHPGSNLTGSNFPVTDIIIPLRVLI